ncbi:MAG TPA: hypothetical protein VFE98_06640 [Candidatus Bathyarchaeia archaeon]|nr:hypothetical protein [Candidatus Bathyarchaeia archaeon]
MLAKLLKFVLITRFSKPLLALIAIIFAYNLVTGILSPRRSPTFPVGFQYYAVVSSAFFVSLSLLFGGLFVLKSDRDYLLTLPLSKKELSISLFMAQFLGSGMSLLFFYGFLVASIGNLDALILLAVDLAVFAAITTSLGVISNILRNRTKAILAGILGVWCLSALSGFQFTPVSMFTGNLIQGSIVISLLGIVTIPLAFKELSEVELGSMRSLLRSTSTEYKKNLSFQGRTSLGAIYAYHLSFLELAGRINIGGTTSYKTARVKTRTILIASTALAVAYFLFVTFASTTIRLLPVAVLPIALGLFVVMLTSQAAFSNERGWLAFTAMDPATYLRHLLISKILSTLAITGPFAVVNAVLFFDNVRLAANSLILLLVTVPTSSIIATYFVARLGAVQQIREEGMMPGQFNLRQLVVALTAYVLIGLMAASAFSFMAAAIIAVVLSALAGILMAIPGVWRGIVYRLTEKGFV